MKFLSIGARSATDENLRIHPAVETRKSRTIVYSQTASATSSFSGTRLSAR
jgi:hypothetical protein